MDTDWAPEYMVRLSLDLLIKAQVKATIFLTGEYNCVREYQGDLLEFGIHPNFARDFSNPIKVIDDIRALVPKAVGTRSHNLIQSTPILSQVAQAGLNYDCSYLCFGVPYLSAYRDWNNLVRIPYYWEDDTHSIYGLPWTVAPFLESPGLKIFNFHPVHIYLNMEVLARYERLKVLGALPQLTDAQTAEHINTGSGTQTFMKELLVEIAIRKITTFQLQEVANCVCAELEAL